MSPSQIDRLIKVVERIADPVVRALEAIADGVVAEADAAKRDREK